jgi:hypothetical protein
MGCLSSCSKRSLRFSTTFPEMRIVWGTDAPYERDIRTDSLNDLGPASFLEVLIALSKRLAFNAGRKNAPGWAWILLTNLNLHKLTDPFTKAKTRKANDILNRCIRREYEPDGSGGFFPLAEATEDQREVEIWYQMSAYISQMERGR